MYKLDNISYEQIFEYIDEFNFKANEKLDNLRIKAEKDNIPIIKKDVENFLGNFLKISKPKRILEIGCAVGYSSIFLSKSLNDDVIIDTLEISQDMNIKAKENIKNFNLNNINIILGDALDTIPNLTEKYDLVFMDAAKGHYDEFYKLILKNLNKNAIIICDNILFRGHLCVTRQEVPRRLRTIYSRMNTFFENIKNDENLSYNLLPLGDGVLIIYFK